jgi:molybdopterin synthase catalytic subunit
VVVKVLFFGVLKDLTGLSEETVEIAPATTLGGLLDQYTERFETLKAARPSILLARNREFSSPDAPLTDQDEIAFLPPVSGGSTPSGNLTGGKAGFVSFVEDKSGSLFALTRQPIESQVWARELQRGEDGATIVFEGIVRNNTKGRPTRYLEYECYEPMALDGLARIGREIAAERAIGRIALIHRLGRLEIGEASVAVIVTAAHRKPAFEAALEGIDRLKREVPIWKREFFEDGAVWVEGEWDDKLPGRAKTS